MRNRYFVCYDVSDPKRLRYAYKKMNGYGDPVQYSVFVCELNEQELIYMKEDMGKILNFGEDRLLVINTGQINKNKKDDVFTMGVHLDNSKERVIVI